MLRCAARKFSSAVLRIWLASQLTTWPSSDVTNTLSHGGRTAGDEVAERMVEKEEEDGEDGEDDEDTRKATAGRPAHRTDERTCRPTKWSATGFVTE